MCLFSQEYIVTLLKQGSVFTVVVVKGQKISERNCDVLNVSKKQRNCFYLLDKLKPETVGVTLSDEEDVKGPQREEKFWGTSCRVSWALESKG